MQQENWDFCCCFHLHTDATFCASIANLPPPYQDTMYEREISSNSGLPSLHSEEPRLSADSGCEDIDPVFNYHVKLLLLGDSNVGKTCVLTRFADAKFDNSMLPTTGVNFKNRFVDVDDGTGKKVARCQVWDTAGMAWQRGTAWVVVICPFWG